MNDYYGPTRNDTKSILQWLLLGVLIVFVLGIAAYSLGWIFAPLDVMSPSNIQALSRTANDEWQSLEAQRTNIGVLEQKAHDFILLYGEDRSNWPQGKGDEYLQLRQQVTNQMTAYNNNCGQYQAMWEDAWRNLPAPDDLPKKCPSME